ncbi:putative signal transducing protein, partial [Aeromonas rivipollensis]
MVRGPASPVHRLGVARRGYMEQWINLYRASHSLEAHALKGALEVEGVR